jgi:DNA polymerase I-like protein with 3'-5' exonuclease and polymerase domains
MVQRWRKKYGKEMNWDSNQQMADILYNEMGYGAKELTEGGQPATRRAALEALKIPEIEQYIHMCQLEDARNKFLQGVMRETIKGGDGLYYLHPFFHLNTAQTFRSSSSDPNFQNFPKRVPEIMKIIRRAMKPRPGRRLGEIDFSGVEIRGAYCYHKDPGMYAEITDPSRDMHRDMGMECFLLTPEEMGPKGSPTYKVFRHCGKNKYVFPEFYGDYYASIAQALWDEMSLLDIKTAQGVPAQQHLRTKGIRNYKAYEKHIEEVERRFWGERFPVYAKWKKRQIRGYERNGYVDLLTGFRCYGPMKRNQAINYPVQGASFHMLLWSFIRLTEIAEQRKWSTKLVGQIHDSIVFDIDPREEQEVLETAFDVMTKQLPAAWKWITVPLEVEADLSEIDGDWSKMKTVEV